MTQRDNEYETWTEEFGKIRFIAHMRTTSATATFGLKRNSATRRMSAARYAKGAIFTG